MTINATQQNTPTPYPRFSELALTSRIRIALITFLVSLFTFGFGGKITYNSLRGRVSPPLSMPIDGLAKMILDRNKRIEEEEYKGQDDSVLISQKQIRESNIKRFKELYRLGDKPKTPEGNEVVSQLKLQPSAGQTHAHEAAKKGYITFIEKLVKKHPDWLNARDDYGHTPLHVALFEKQEEMALALIGMGAEHEINERQPFTLLKLAKRYGLTKVEDRLKRLSPPV